MQLMPTRVDQANESEPLINSGSICWKYTQLESSGE